MIATMLGGPRGFSLGVLSCDLLSEGPGLGLTCGPEDLLLILGITKHKKANRSRQSFSLYIGMQ